MKRLNKELRELRPMNPSIYSWMSDIPVEEQIVHVKSYANMQLRETLSVSQSNKMQMELRIYKLKQENRNYDKELFLMKRMDRNIDKINKAIEENHKYISEYFGYEFE
tara:strand:+ start:106 stop:429 length:324 start_codon:yes stop_codon:yes gene_type:complete